MEQRTLDSTRAWILAVVVVSVGLYATTLRHGFAYDDYPIVVENRLVQSLDRLPILVASPEWRGIDHLMYRPLTGVTYALNHAMSGLSPWSYHATNVVLHALASALLLLVALRLGLGPIAAGAAALLFAVHPIHVEAVANVVGRKDLLATVFALAMLLLHRRASLRGGLSLAWPVLAFAATMLSKEVGVVGVGVVALHDLSLPRPDATSVPRLRRIALYAAYAAALGGYLALRSAVIGGAGGPTSLSDNVIAHVDPSVRVMTAFAVIGHGLAVQLLPLGQSPDWSFDAIPIVASPFDPRFLGTAAALGAWLAAGVALRRRAPVVLVGLAWYLGTLLPVSNLLFATGVVFAERLLYLPSAGLALAVAAALWAIPARIPRAPVRIASVGAAVALCAGTLSYSHAWGDELRLFRHAAASVPRSSRVHMMLAFLLLERGEPAGALEEAEASIALNPWVQGAHVARAKALHALGRSNEEAQASRAALAAARGDEGLRIRPPDEEKVRALRAVLATAPSDAEALHGLARQARDAGRFEEASTLWRRAIAANPRDAPALADYARYLLLVGQEDFAFSLALLAVDADPASPGAWNVLGKIYRTRGDTARSRRAFERFLETAGPADSLDVVRARRVLDTR